MSLFLQNISFNSNNRDCYFVSYPDSLIRLKLPLIINIYFNNKYLTYIVLILKPYATVNYFDSRRY